MLAIIFLIGAGQKLRDVAMFAAAIEQYRLLPQSLSVAAAWSLVTAELAAAVLLLPLSTRSGGALLAALVLGVVTLAVVVNLLRGRRAIDCGCGGPLGQSAPVVGSRVAQHRTRVADGGGWCCCHAARTGLARPSHRAGRCAGAVRAVCGGQPVAGQSATSTETERLNPMTDALVVSNLLLWAVVLALLVAVFALTRQIGILYERVAPMGALMIDTGPEGW